MSVNNDTMKIYHLIVTVDQKQLHSLDTAERNAVHKIAQFVLTGKDSQIKSINTSRLKSIFAKFSKGDELAEKSLTNKVVNFFESLIGLRISSKKLFKEIQETKAFLETNNKKLSELKTRIETAKNNVTETIKVSAEQIDFKKEWAKGFYDSMAKMYPEIDSQDDGQKVKIPDAIKNLKGTAIDLIDSAIAKNNSLTDEEKSKVDEIKNKINFEPITKEEVDKYKQDNNLSDDEVDRLDLTHRHKLTKGEKDLLDRLDPYLSDKIDILHNQFLDNLYNMRKADQQTWDRELPVNKLVWQKTANEILNFTIEKEAVEGARTHLEKLMKEKSLLEEVVVKRLNALEKLNGGPSSPVDF